MAEKKPVRREGELQKSNRQTTGIVTSVKQSADTELNHVRNQFLECSTKPGEVGAYSEVNPSMAKVIEAELQDLMTNVWRSLPDKPSEPAEKMIVDNFRNELGHDLKNILGLNISKRLLNIHNTLFVKLVFSFVPEPEELGVFLASRGLKECGGGGRARLARCADLTHFDRLLARTDYKCGKASVTITPCYQFMKCPPQLRSVYACTTKQGISTKKTGEKSIKKQSELQTTTDVDMKTIQKQDKTKTAVNMTKKQCAQKKVQNISQKFVNVSKVDTKVSKVDTKVSKVDTKVSKVDTKVSKVDTKVSKVDTKVSKVDTKISQRPNIESAFGKKKIVPNKLPSVKANTGKSVTNKTVTKPTKSDKKGEKYNSLDENNLEELDDYDILALLNEGVVLDECSGSDEE